MEQDILPEGSAPEGEQEQVSQPTVVEQEAIDSGWVPKDQYNGEEHKWVDAAEFLRRGELFKKIEDQSRQLKDVKRALVEFKKLHEGVREVEYKRALETLRAQKKAALEDGDADAVIAADERIDLVKEEQRRLQAETPEIEDAPSGEAAPEFTAWKAKNSWYTSNAPMKAFADTLGTQLARSGLTPIAVLKRVEEEVRKEFPNRFRNPNQDKPSGVEGSKPRGSSSSSFQMTPEETRIMKTIVRTGVMTEEQYKKDLKIAKGL